MSIQIIENAMKNKSRITIIYPQHGMSYYENGKPKPYGGPEIFRAVAPFVLGPSKKTGRLLLRGYDYRRKEWRLFYVDKAKIETLKTNFKLTDPIFNLFRREKADNAMSSIKSTVLDYDFKFKAEQKVPQFLKKAFSKNSLLGKLLKR